MPELVPWAYWNQLDDPMTADGRPDENRIFNCGAEAVAEIVWYTHGVELPADYFKDRIRGESYQGYLYTGDLVTALTRWGGVPAQEWQADAYTATGRIAMALDNARPVIVLLYIDPANENSGHFCTAIGYDTDNIILADPWGGYRRAIGWAEFQSVWWKGWAVEAFIHRHPEL